MLFHHGSVTIGFTLLGSSMSLAPVTPILRVGLTPPTLAVSTIMACWVFREITLAACIEECQEETELEALNGARMPVFTSVGVVSGAEAEAKTLSEPEGLRSERERGDLGNVRLTNHTRNDSESMRAAAVGLDAV